MHPMLAFYKQTWWLWLLFVVVFSALAYFVTPLFALMVPGIVLYSIYFGIVRTSELREAELEALRARSRAAATPRANGE